MPKFNLRACTILAAESSSAQYWPALCVERGEFTAPFLVCPATCGVTWVLLTYWSCASRQTRRLKMLWGSGPKEKYLTTACTTHGSLLERPCLSASCASLRWMFCLKNDNNSVSSSVIARPEAAAILQKRAPKTTRGHMISPWGGGMLGNFQQNSRILILSVYSLSNVCNK